MTTKSYAVLLELLDFLERENEELSTANLRRILKEEHQSSNVIYVKELDRANPEEMRDLMNERDGHSHFLLENISIDDLEENNDTQLIEKVIDSITAKETVMALESGEKYDIFCVE